MKTKPALISSINALVSAVGDKFEPDEDADAERDFMAQRCPRRMERLIRTLPTL
ncbi:transcriptional regulator, partial [Mycobacteroides abscessus subsp. massiliense]|nr:transcriptional regulator [Mycobacteroides abscessus subsp. massiliense]